MTGTGTLTDFQPRSRVIGLLWHTLDSANYGIGALTLAHFAIFEEIEKELDCQISFEMAGWFDSAPKYVVHPRMTFHPFSQRFILAPRGGLAEMARRCDVVFDISAGDSFTDSYGFKRIWFQLISKAIVLTSGTPLVLAPQTVGPFSRAWARQAARVVMRRCKTVVTRDNLSTTFVRALDPAIRVAEVTDVAFRLTYKDAAVQRGRKVRVGIN